MNECQLIFTLTQRTPAYIQMGWFVVQFPHMKTLLLFSLCTPILRMIIYFLLVHFYDVNMCVCEIREVFVAVVIVARAGARKAIPCKVSFALKSKSR